MKNLQPYNIVIFRFIAALVIGVAIVGLALHLLAPKSLENNFGERNRKLIEELNTQKPELVIFGDSMVVEGFDEFLYMKLSGRTLGSMARAGDGSASWYLIFKNTLAKADHKPKRAVIVFRDYNLTEATNKVDGKYKKRIDELRSSEEPELDHLAYGMSQHWFIKLQERLFPHLKNQALYKEALENFGKKLVAGWFTSGDLAKLSDAQVDIFADANMNQVLLTQQQLKLSPPKSDVIFDEALPRSFLPLVFKYAKEAGIELTFVRYRTLQNAKGIEADEPLKRYITELKKYIAEQGARYVDFTEDKRIQVEHFAAGDHLNREEGRKIFTTMISEAI